MYGASDIACFFGGIFLANAVPHFVNGVSGDPFPTPFARPPGKGLSPPTLNVVWALINMAVGYSLLKLGDFSTDEHEKWAAVFIGGALISLLLSRNFAKKQKNSS